MRRNKYKLLGDGSEGSVWALGANDHVLKIMFTEDAKPSLAFRDFCLANKSKHVPKYYDTAQVAFDNVVSKPPPSRFTSLTSISMEKLAPVSRKRVAALYGEMLKEKDWTAFEHKLHAYAKAHGLKVDLFTEGNILLRGSVLVVVDGFSKKY